METISNVDPLLVATPIFFVAIIAENIYLYFKGRTLRLNDSLSSLASGGFFSVEFLLLMQESKIGGYLDSLFKSYQIERLGIISSIILLFLVDLSYYFAHFSSHNISLLWALHSPHHSSEEYNFTTALRQGALESLSNFFFFLPWCFIFPFETIIYFRKINLIWQFWTHTEIVYKLPKWFESFFNTPSHHRVHHARNKIYIDKNFGGMFIIWDKMFGTYAEETEKPVYGLVHPIQTFEPVAVQLVHFKTLYEQLLSLPTFYLKLKALTSPPGFFYDPVTKKSFVLDVPDEIDKSIPKLDTKGNDYSNFLSIFSFMIVFFSYFWIKDHQFHLSLLPLTCWQLFLVFTLSNIFLISENKQYHRYYFLCYLLSLFTVCISDFLLMTKTFLMLVFTIHFVFQKFVLYCF